MNHGDAKAASPPVSQHLSYQQTSPSTDSAVLLAGAVLGLHAQGGCGRRVAYEIALTSRERVQGLLRNCSPAAAIILPLLSVCCLKLLPIFSYAESQSDLEETTQSFLGAGKKMEENTNHLHCYLMQSVFRIPLFSEGGSREPPATIGNDTQLS